MLKSQTAIERAGFQHRQSEMISAVIFSKGLVIQLAVELQLKSRWPISGQLLYFVKERSMATCDCVKGTHYSVCYEGL